MARQQGAVAGEYHLAGCHIAVLNLGLHRAVGIADDSSAALALWSYHRADEGAVAEGGILVTHGEESAIGGVACKAARDVHIDNDVLEGTVAAAGEAQTANEALGALDSALHHEVADDGIAHHLEECHTVIAHTIVNSDGMSLTVEDTSLEGHLVVVFIGRVSIAANHHVLLGVGGEIDVGAKAGAHLLVTVIHQCSKPGEVIGGIDSIETVGDGQVVDVHFATDATDAF